MVDEANGALDIVEAKNQRNAENSQLNNNVRLAMRLRGGVVDALRQEVSYQEAVNAAYSAIPEVQNLPPVIRSQFKFPYAVDLPDRRYTGRLGSLPALEEVMNGQTAVVESEHDPYEYSTLIRLWGIVQSVSPLQTKTTI